MLGLQGLHICVSKDYLYCLPMYMVLTLWFVFWGHMQLSYYFCPSRHFTLCVYYLKHGLIKWL